ncbi:MAG TPA: OmpA family protein [Mucilaginibacter sp.]|jgi:outer membrane protein OmpA-like peptidoglycan-associated protein/tetratricopeptide (TPR) repeat protein
MKRLIFICLWTIALVKYAGAQEQLSIKQQAGRLFERYEYFKSLGLYLKLVKNQTDVQILERIADCYRNMNRYDEAEAWYARVAADPKASKISHYYYAEALLRNKKFDLAKQQFRLYFTNDPNALRLKLADCDSAVLWIGQKSVYKVTNEKNLNTEYSDWGLNYEGNTGLVFTSDRIVDYSDIDNRTGNNWFKLYEASLSKEEIKELPIIADDNGIFHDAYHVGPVAFNKTADTAYITITTTISAKKIGVDKPGLKSSQRLYTRRLQLLMAGRKNSQWTVFGVFPYNNIQKYSIGDAALSKDSHLIYFTSDMPGGEGKTDIWYCEKRADGSWGNPVNCGKTINTKEEEAFPNIGGDGALYYSSKGLIGMGGYDIYVAKGEKSEWSTPKNLKYPINSTSDDFYLVTRDGLSGYFSSIREGGQGNDDIYSFTYKPNDSIGPKPIKPPDTSKSIVGQPQKTEPSLVLKTIYYDLDKSNIRPNAAVELDKLVMVLKQHPMLKIEISSYTDSRASDQYNMALSQRRAASAVAYLAKRGISTDRLVVRYYGETHPVNKCAGNVKCTEAEHQLNRRTEFRVIGGRE